MLASRVRVLLLASGGELCVVSRDATYMNPHGRRERVRDSKCFTKRARSFI